MNKTALCLAKLWGDRQALTLLVVLYIQSCFLQLTIETMEELYVSFVLHWNILHGNELKEKVAQIPVPLFITA